MKRIWWTWDIRMRWAHGFSMYPDSFVNNYRRLIDVAGRYGVDGIVIWGFLRDTHGGIESAKKIVDYADAHGVKILPGVGIDDYGGVYYEGDSKYALDNYIKNHPECQAINEDGTPATHRWPPTDTVARLKACPSNQDVLNYYRESLAWLIETFSLQGFQIEQGDSGLCYCEKCREKSRVALARTSTSLSDAAQRIPYVVGQALHKSPDLIIISETYSGLTRNELEKIQPLLEKYQDEIYISWQFYDGPYGWAGYEYGTFRIDEGVVSPTMHGNAAIRTNNDAFFGEIDDAANIAKAVKLAKNAGLDMTYLYGEYPDDWPITANNYRSWAGNS